MAISTELTGVKLTYQQYMDPRVFAALEPKMVEAARETGNKAVSYRNFRVGACAAVLLRRTDEVVFLASGNYSPYRGVPRNAQRWGF